MAEGNAAENKKAEEQQAPKPTLLIALIIINMLVVFGVGLMLYLGQQKEASMLNIDDIMIGENEKQKVENESREFIGRLVPMETFLVNLAGARGRKLVKINMEFEVDKLVVQEEIDKLKPKIRDIIIILLSSKTYSQISSQEGKETLRNEIKDQVNLFLTKGQVKQVYFTELLYN